ncbi:hypothetical protein [Martelella mediterranea]|nr:hypothetical protein [Martelella mediterranea]
MKILHEIETAPDFGEMYIADATSAPQQWIARIGALLARLGIEHKLAFNNQKSITVRYWALSRESFRQLLVAAAEEIKLELELEGHEHIGEVYESQRQYDFLKDLSEIISAAQTSVFVVDPYFDGATFQTYFTSIGGRCEIKVLCGRYANDVAGHLSAFKAQYGREPLLRKSRDLHDRLVIVDGNDCWIVGGSIKDAGKKPTYLVPLQPTIATTKIAIYEDLWKQAVPVQDNKSY